MSDRVRAELGWTEKRTAELCALWSAGWTASDIAEALGVTRNAVMGKVDREGLLGLSHDEKAARWRRGNVRRLETIGAQRKAAP